MTVQLIVGNNIGDEWIVNAQTNDFRMHYIMPYTIQKLGDIRGLKILDLGCGEGGYSRELASKGAVVTAVDCSEMFINYAILKAKEENLQILHFIKNSNDLSGFINNSFDIVLCAMMLMDVEYYDGTLKEIYRVIKPAGIVFISILHPCFKPPVEHKWFYENDAIQVVIKNYFHPTEWIGRINGIEETVIYRHKTLSEYIKGFINNVSSTKNQATDSQEPGIEM